MLVSDGILKVTLVSLKGRPSIMVSPTSFIFLSIQMYYQVKQVSIHKNDEI